MSYANDRIVDAVVSEIRDRMKPEDVFDEKQLEQWAIDNGFTKDEEQ